MNSEARTTEDDEGDGAEAVPLRRTSTRSRKDPEKAKFLHGVRDIFICTPRAAAASALCVRRRPARPVPKLTSLASGRGRG